MIRKENVMNIENKTILITGANRGIGRALVEEALKRGAKRVYAATRQPFTHSDRRVTHLTLDVTNAAQIQDAVKKVEALDILINNAGVDLHEDLSERANLERHLAVNLFGTYGVSQAFLPLVARSQGGRCQRPVVGGLGERAVHARLLDLKGSGVFADAIAACFLGRARGEGSCRYGRSRGHRNDAIPRHTKVFCGVRRTRHPRRPGERRRGHLPRSHVGVHRRGLARRRNQSS